MSDIFDSRDLLDELKTLDKIDDLDRIAEIEVILGNISSAPVYAQLTPIKVLQPTGGEV